MSQSALDLGVDIGGTFTDVVLYDPLRGRLSIGKTLTTPDDPARGALAGLRAVLDRHRDAGPGHPPGDPRHDPGDERPDRAQGGRHGLRHHRRVSGRLRDRAPEAVRHVRPGAALPRAAGAPRPALRGRRSGSTPPGASAGRWTRARCRPWRRACGRRGGGRRHLPAAHLPGAGARAGPGGGPARGRPERPRSRSRRRSAPEIREYPRASTTVANAYVQHLTERYLERLQAGLRGPGLPRDALRHALPRGAGHGGHGRALPHPAAGVGPGRRRPGGRLPRQPAWARRRRGPGLRHGRHDGQGLPPRRRRGRASSAASRWRASTASSGAAACRSACPAST